MPRQGLALLSSCLSLSSSWIIVLSHQAHLLQFLTYSFKYKFLSHMLTLLIMLRAASFQGQILKSQMILMVFISFQKKKNLCVRISLLEGYPVPKPELICWLEHRQELWRVMNDLSAIISAGKGSGQGWWALLGTPLSLLLYLLFLSLPVLSFSLSFLSDFVCVCTYMPQCSYGSQGPPCASWELVSLSTAQTLLIKPGLLVLAASTFTHRIIS